MDISQKLFNSPTYGVLTLEQIHQKISKFMGEVSDKSYRLIIGTDSQPKGEQGADFVTAIVIHRVGMGGIYFWQRKEEKKKMVLRNRIYEEAVLSLSCAQELLATFKNNGITKYDVEIHVDIGTHGETRELIAEVVGMIRGSGFLVKTKPDSYGATKVADRHT